MRIIVVVHHLPLDILPLLIVGPSLCLVNVAVTPSSLRRQQRQEKQQETLSRSKDVADSVWQHHFCRHIDRPHGLVVVVTARADYEGHAPSVVAACCFLS
jgi:hypothetical protein